MAVGSGTADALDEPTETVRIRVRVARRRQRCRRGRHLLRIAVRALIGFAVAVAVVVAWIAVRGLQARHDLTNAANGIQQVRLDLLSADSARAAQDLAGARVSAAAADRETHDPVWSAAGTIPVLGAPVRTTAGIADISRSLTDVTLPVLVRAAGIVSSQRIKISHGRVNLEALGAQAAPLGTADTSVASALERAQSLGAGWLGPVSAGRTQLITELTPLSGEVHVAAVTARIGPAMLGADGARNYFVAFQNDAEARGTGGIAGAYVILHADRGKLTVAARGSDARLRDDLPPVAVPTGLTQQFPGAGAGHIWRNANVGAAFDTAANTWAHLWQEQFGQRLDGAFAVDPTVLSYILAVTGPATTSTGQTVTAANAVQLTEQATYNTFSGQQSTRKSFLQLVSSATVDRALSAPSSAGPGLLQALRRAAGEHRLLLASTVPGEEQALLTTDAGGGLPPSFAPTAAMTLVNASGNKIDYYVASSLRYVALTCSGTYRDVTVTAKITNSAPTSGLPPIVTARLDGGSGPPGSELSLWSYAGTVGTQVESVSLDGAAATVNASTNGRHPVFTMPITLLPGGATRTVVLHLREPVLPGPVGTRPQPLVQPQRVTIDAPTCRH